MKFFVCLALLICGSLAYKNPNFADNHSVIIHMFEWKWTDIAKECEAFLGPKGYGGVQVSPPNENLMVSSRNRTWWERYQPISYKIATRSGNEEEFADMVKRCNKVGVRIYVDAVINHMTGTWVENVGTGGSIAEFEQWNFPGVPFTKADFNDPVCDINNYSDAENVRNCQLVGLKDLDQSIPSVREKISAFMNKLIGFGVAGFRIDAAKHMWPKDLEAIYDSLDDVKTEFGFPANRRPYFYQEVIDFKNEGVSYKEYIHIGDVTEMACSQELSQSFRGHNSLSHLWNWGEDENWLIPSEHAFVFIDNHDNQRGHGAGDGNIMTYKRPKPYKAAIAFLLAHTYGEPKIMSSYAFEDSDIGPPMDANYNTVSPTINADGSCGNGWVCEHRWGPIVNMVGFRNAILGTPLTNWWTNGNNQIAFCRGNKGFYASNIEEGELNQTLQTCLPAGTYCDVITGGTSGSGCAGKTVVVDGSGNALIKISPDEEEASLAIHVGPQSKLN